MSFEAQERALFDLLFDDDLRDQFCSQSLQALSSYDLNDEELKDFAEIRPDALALDAKMRRNFLLAHLCRAFPVSFAIITSYSSGKSLLQKLVDSRTMRANSIERPGLFATRLREALIDFSFDNNTEQALIIAILEAELAMALTSASLKQEVLDSGRLTAVSRDVPDDWSSKMIKLASHVGAAIIPRPYKELKQDFCPVSDSNLWSELSRNPISKSSRQKILLTEVPRLLVVRARLTHMSLCEPKVDHQTVELSDGFASLFEHVNGNASVDQILAQLKLAGASAQILAGVREGFEQLLRNSMLEIS